MLLLNVKPVNSVGISLCVQAAIASCWLSKGKGRWCRSVFSVHSELLCAGPACSLSSGSWEGAAGCSVPLGTVFLIFWPWRESSERNEPVGVVLILLAVRLRQQPG